MQNTFYRRRLLTSAALAVVGIGAVAMVLIVASGNPGTVFAANPSASPALPSASAKTGDRDWMGPGGMHGFPGARLITITAINGSSLSLKTDDGWTRTIDATGATVTSAGQTVSLSSLKVGDTIRFGEQKQTDGTWKITSIDVVLPTVNGTVKSKTASTIVVTTIGGGTATVNVSATTTYSVRGVANATLANVSVGDRIEAEGTLGGDGSLNAVRVEAGGIGGPGFGGMGRGHGFGPGKWPGAKASPSPSSSTGSNT